MKEESKLNRILEKICLTKLELNKIQVGKFSKKTFVKSKQSVNSTN